MRPRGRLGFFSSCEREGDDDTFQALNKIRIYPGKINNWLVIRTSEASDTIKDFIEDHIVDPLDTSWVNDNVNYTVQEVSGDKVLLTFKALGLKMQEKRSTSLNPPVVGKTDNLRFFLVKFIPPNDAPHELPWPVVGCLENPEWYLNAATTDISATTGQTTENVVAKVQRDIAIQDAQKEAEARSIREQFGIKTPWEQVRPWIIGGVIVVGGIYLAPAIARAVVGVRRASRA